MRKGLLKHEENFLIFSPSKIKGKAENSISFFLSGVPERLQDIFFTVYLFGIFFYTKFQMYRCFFCFCFHLFIYFVLSSRREIKETLIFKIYLFPFIFFFIIMLKSEIIIAIFILVSILAMFI